MYLLSLNLSLSVFLSLSLFLSPAEAPENDLQPALLRTAIPGGGIAGITLGVLISMALTGTAGYFVGVLRSQISALGSSVVTELGLSVWGVQRGLQFWELCGQGAGVSTGAGLQGRNVPQDLETRTGAGGGTLPTCPKFSVVIRSWAPQLAEVSSNPLTSPSSSGDLGKVTQLLLPQFPHL